MKKFFTQKAFLLLTLLFVLLAAASFAAFRETEQVCQQVQCAKVTSHEKNGNMIWEVVSRQFLSLLAI
ncbi:MAG TPA: hypothetical protein VEX65_11925 [Flavisolibacter sp.]|jgi:CHASE3 domain sensor protein|nr:hypothetical protein [Flavisolibacter sp.]